MNTGTFSKEFKKQAVLKFINRGSQTVDDLAEKLNTTSGSLYRWYGMLNKGRIVMSNNKRTAEEKLKIIIETSGLSESEIGEYLRKNGLHSSDVKRFEQECLSGIKSAGRPQKDPELFKLRKQEKVLQRDLHRKDKALAEMSARVILLKKSQEIFGDSEDEE